jgi:ABC-type nickel/cobalt efflux system permease component RcnA
MIFGIISGLGGIALIALPFLIPSLQQYKMLMVIGGILLLALGAYFLFSKTLQANRQSKEDQLAAQTALVQAQTQNDPGIYQANTNTDQQAYANCQVACREAHSGWFRTKARNKCLDGCNSFIN